MASDLDLIFAGSCGDSGERQHMGHGLTSLRHGIDNSGEELELA